MARLKCSNGGTVTIAVPDRFRAPVIELDPEAPEVQRRYRAYAAWREYTTELSDWNKTNGPGRLEVIQIQKALGTTFGDFLHIAVELPG